MIRCHREPPSIKGPPKQMEDFEESEETVDSLCTELLELKKKFNNLEERVVEGELCWMDVDDKINVIRKAMCSKIRCITEAIGRPDINAQPLP